MATDYVLTARGSRWIEAFRDEDHARRMVARRGHTLTHIVVATDEARRELAAWQEAWETSSEDAPPKARSPRPAVPDWLKISAAEPAWPALAPLELAASRGFTIGGVLGRGLSIGFENLPSLLLASALISLPLVALPTVLFTIASIVWPLFAFMYLMGFDDGWAEIYVVILHVST